MTQALERIPERTLEAHRFTATESYAHKAAKAVVAGWLREVATSAGLDGFAHLGHISWRVNRGAPHWGVWEEYPIGPENEGLSPVWDETQHFWQCECAPTYGECLKVGPAPLYVCDIAIQHKGLISTVIEIHHKHALTEDKIRWLRFVANVDVIELPARWVLGQIERPATIPDEFRLW